MTFDPALNPGEPVNGQTPQPPIDRHLDAVYSALAHGFPGAIDDLHTAARSAGHLFGNGVADALGRIVGNLGDLTAGTRSDLVYLRRAIDDRHAAMLIELDAAHRDAVIHRHLVDEARVELAAATVDATTRLMALQDVRRKLTDVATFAKTSGAVDWFAVVDSAVRTIDAATADPGNGDPAAGDNMTGDLLGRWPRSHAEAGVAPDPEPVFVNGRPTGVAPDPEPVFVNGRPIYVADPGHWAAAPEPAGTIIPAEPGDTAAGS